MYKRAVIIAILLFFLLPIGFVVAQDSGTRTVTDEIVRGDVTLLNENFDLAESGQVSGSVTIFNGDAKVSGTISQDLVVFNGNIVLSETAVVRGECVIINGTLTNEDEEQHCQEISEIPIDIDLSLLNSIDTDFVGTSETFTRGTRFFGAFGGALGLSLLMGGIALGIYTALPEQSRTIEQTLRQSPYSSVALGGLSFVAIPFINSILLMFSVILSVICIGILGFPFVIIITFAFIVAGCWAWVLWGKMAGDWFTTVLDRQWQMPTTAALGTAVVTFILAFLTFINPVSGILMMIVAFVMQSSGMGAAALTRFGTQPFPSINPKVDEEKVTAVLKTLPDEQ